MGGCEVTHCFIYTTRKKSSPQAKVTERMLIFVKRIDTFDKEILKKMDIIN